jgi:2-haloacid dehalogenase
VTFDCYGTLVDWQTGLSTMLAPIAGDRATDVARAFGVHQLALEREQPYQPHKRVLAGALTRAAHERGVPLTAASAQALTGSWASLRPFADVEAMLAELRRKGYRLGVLTNVDDDLFEITHRSFATPFHLFVTAERVRGFKPQPWLFRAFARLTGVDRRDWVHVGSNWDHDIEPARALGVRQVWLDRANAPGREGVVHAASSFEAVCAIDQLFARN